MPHATANGLQSEAAQGRLSYVAKQIAPLPAWSIGLLMLFLLGGCVNGRTSATADVFAEVFAPPDDQTSRAADIPFASLSIDTGERSGLVVLGAISGSNTFWPTGHHGLISLRHDGLQATAGLSEDLLDTRYPQSEKDTPPPWRQKSPRSFDLIRTWQDTEGLIQTLSADGQLTCGPAKQRKLPLATLKLEPCTLTLDWQDGRTTQGTLWRAPDSLHVWAGEEQAWPDGPTIRWEVARPWW
ncbi:hypothetical protein GCM10022228_07600 [Halomonas cibimaris]|uniref:YjbF family lipoprotein n=1 Tax=Halomonas cibimaris TaxID=657012 RepID=A0ABP7LFW2_9GAMM